MRSFLSRFPVRWLCYLAYFVGVSFQSGGIVHYSLDPKRYLRLIVIGAFVFLIGAVASDMLDTASVLRGSGITGFVRFVISSLVLSIGVGMIGGSVQHFLDIPKKAPWLIGLGIVLSAIGFHGRFRPHLGRRELALGIGLATALAIPIMAGLRSYASGLPVATDHHGAAASGSDAHSGDAHSGDAHSGDAHSGDAHTDEQGDTHTDPHTGESPDPSASAPTTLAIEVAQSTSTAGGGLVASQVAPAPAVTTVAAPTIVADDHADHVHGAPDTSTSTFNAADLHFVEHMIPHHAQAVEMASIALDPARGASSSVTDLARRIRDGQQPEIDRMNAFLLEWGKSPDSEGQGGKPSAEHGSSGMLSADDLGRLGSLNGVKFDRMWMDLMIKHHQGAIMTANTVVASGSDPRVHALAEGIVAAQEAEIAQMKSELAR